MEVSQSVQHERIDVAARVLAGKLKQAFRWVSNWEMLEAASSGDMTVSGVHLPYGTVSYYGFLHPTRTGIRAGAGELIKEAPSHYALLGVLYAGADPMSASDFRRVVHAAALLLGATDETLVVLRDDVDAETPRLVEPSFRTKKPRNYSLSWDAVARE